MSSVGDILMALFPLVINARIIFEGYTAYTDLSCSSRILSGVYSGAFMPYVYAIALITLSFELQARTTIKNQFPSAYVASFVIAGLPWVSGLILILPLNLAGFDSDLCIVKNMNIDRVRAIIIVGVIIPCFFAAVMSFIKPKDYSSDVYSAVDSSECSAQSESLALICVAIATLVLAWPNAFYNVITDKDNLRFESSLQIISSNKHTFQSALHLTIIFISPQHI